MKKNLKIIALIPSILMSLTSCKITIKKKVIEYLTAFMTSDFQAETHDIKLAKCDQELYIEVPNDCKLKQIEVEKTDNVTTYFIDDEEEVFKKVTDKGWKYVDNKTNNNKTNNK